METTKVGVREFRRDLAGHIASNAPVAVTRHGQTVGYFIPTQGPSEEEIAAFDRAARAFQKLLDEHGIDEETLVAEFKALRKQAQARKKLAQA
jgi:hypothetical protein